MNKNTTILVIGILVIAILGFLIFRNDTPPISSPDTSGGNVIHEPPTGFVDDLVPKTSELGKNVTLKIDQRVTFSDGLSVRLKRIDDSRCKPGVQCIWQGELSGLFDVSGGKLKTPAELRMGTEKFKTQHLDGYKFELKSATENSATIVVTIPPAPVVKGGCYIGGCSGQICSDQQDVASTCEYRAEYMCYQSATCERQSTGQCGWTETTALKQCLSNS